MSRDLKKKSKNSDTNDAPYILFSLSQLELYKLFLTHYFLLLREMKAVIELVEEDRWVIIIFEV